MQPYGMPGRHHRCILYRRGSQDNMALCLKEPRLLVDSLHIPHVFQQLEDIPCNQRNHTVFPKRKQHNTGLP